MNTIKDKLDSYQISCHSVTDLFKYFHAYEINPLKVKQST